MSRPVQPHHLHEMAVRMSDAARDRAWAVLEAKGSALKDPTYLRAVARHERRMKALSRLTRALERRLDGLEYRR